MISQLTVFTISISDRPYNFLCSPDSPTEDIKKAITEMLVMVSKAEENIKAQIAAQEKKSEEIAKPVEGEAKGED